MFDDEDERTCTVSALQAAPAGRESAFLIVVTGRTSIGKMFKLDRRDGHRPSRRRRHLARRRRHLAPARQDRRAARRHRPAGRPGLDQRHLPSTASEVNVAAAAGRRQDPDRLDHDRSSSRYQDQLDEPFQKNIYESATRDGLTRSTTRSTSLDTLQQGVRLLPAAPGAPVADHVRHRSLQEDQRHLRPPGRRLRAWHASRREAARDASAPRTSSRATAARSSRSCCASRPRARPSSSPSASPQGGALRLHLQRQPDQGDHQPRARHAGRRELRAAPRSWSRPPTSTSTGPSRRGRNRVEASTMSAP